MKVAYSLGTVVLEVTTEGIRTGTRSGGSEFQILDAATLKLRAPSEVRPHGAESRLVLESLTERVERQAC